MAVGRFQVMAVLQAARALVLGLSESSAKSWGLNRAIFYAAAKRGFKGRPSYRRPKSEIKTKPIIETPEAFHLGNEMAFKAKEHTNGPLFIMSGKTQTIEDYERQIEARFKGNFKQAWEEALALVQGFDQEILLSQNKFFNLVYKPNRDQLAAKWTEELAK